MRDGQVGLKTKKLLKVQCSVKICLEVDTQYSARYVEGVVEAVSDWFGETS